jgi:hypothetical protein
MPSAPGSHRHEAVPADPASECVSAWTPAARLAAAQGRPSDAIFLDPHAGFALRITHTKPRPDHADRRDGPGPRRNMTSPRGSQGLKRVPGSGMRLAGVHPASGDCPAGMITMNSSYKPTRAAGHCPEATSALAAMRSVK